MKVAYVLREGAYCGRDDLVDWGSGNMPLWAVADPRKLFAAADAYERVNARLYVHVWVALPNELDETERHDLALSIGAALTASGLPYVYAVHAGEQKSPGEPANPHVHFVISERMNDGVERDEELWFRRANRRNPAAGGAAKDRSLKAVTWVEDTRKVIERLINEHLALAWREERVTADSHATRIVEAEAWGDAETAERLRLHPPGIHLGPAAAAMERDRFRGKRGERPELARPGEPTERGDLARVKAAEAERICGELARVSKKLSRARDELRSATWSVAAARAAELTGEEIVAEYEKESRWTAVEAAATKRRKQVKALAESLGIDIAAVNGRGLGGFGVVIGIVEEARALLTDKEIGRIHAEAVSSTVSSLRTYRAVVRGYRRGWKAVADAARERLATAERAACLGKLGGLPGGRELYVAWQTDMYPDATKADGEEVLAAVEGDRERLERARSVFENQWSRIHYVAATGALGDRFSLEEVDAALTEAGAFGRRAGNLPEGVVRVELEAVVGEGKNPTVAELAAALERAEEAERAKEAERRRARARRGAAVRRREAGVRETNPGPGWLHEAKERVLQGADRQPTLEERERIVGMVEEWIREGLDRRQKELRSTQEGARFLEEARRSAGAVKTLAAEEQLVDAAADQLRKFLLKQPGAEDLYDAVLTGLDPRWRDSGRTTTVENIEKAVTLALSDSDRLGLLRDVLAEPGDAACYREALKARGENFIVQDIDVAIEAVLRQREEEAARQQEAEEARQREEEAARRREAEAEAERRREAEAEAERRREAEAEAERRREAEAEAERRREAARKRDARLTRLFGVASGDAAFFAALDARKPTWRETGTGLADIDLALDVAEQRVDRTRKAASADHELVVEAEKTFPGTSSAVWWQAGGKFPVAARHARKVSQRLSDRALVYALAAERAEPPADPGLVRRLVDWLRAPVEKLLDRLLPGVRKAPEVLPPIRREPTVLPPVRQAPEVPSPEARRREGLEQLVSGGIEDAMRRVNGELAVSNEAVDFATAMLVNNDEVDKLARPGVERFQASHEHDADERARAESELLRVAIRQAIAEEEQKLKEEAKSKRRRRKLAPPVEVDAARRKEIEREVREAFRLSLEPLARRIRPTAGPVVARRPQGARGSAAHQTRTHGAATGAPGAGSAVAGGEKERGSGAARVWRDRGCDATRERGAGRVERGR